MPLLQHQLTQSTACAHSLEAAASLLGLAHMLHSAQQRNVLYKNPSRNSPHPQFLTISLLRGPLKGLGGRATALIPRQATAHLVRACVTRGGR